MFRDFLSFIVALWREWKVLLTGGTIFAVLALWNFFGRKPLPQSIGWFIAGFTLILAAFFAWRRQWVIADQNFLALPLETLTQLAQNRTKVHANALIKSYLGKKIRCTGIIENVFPSGILGFVIMECGTLQITLRLSRWRFRAFVHFAKGTPITVVGRIRAVTVGNIELKNCDIVPALPEEKSAEQ